MLAKFVGNKLDILLLQNKYVALLDTSLWVVIFEVYCKLDADDESVLCDIRIYSWTPDRKIGGNSVASSMQIQLLRFNFITS